MKEGDWKPNIPIIPNIHQAVCNMVCGNPSALEMSVWHTCNTTHCRAGWVIHIAGEAGYKLEKETNPAWAALQIYKASSPIEVHLHQFFVTNEEGIADIRRCAEEELALVQKE